MLANGVLASDTTWREIFKYRGFYAKDVVLWLVYSKVRSASGVAGLSLELC